MKLVLFINHEQEAIAFTNEELELIRRSVATMYDNMIDDANSSDIDGFQIDHEITVLEDIRSKLYHKEELA